MSIMQLQDYIVILNEKLILIGVMSLLKTGTEYGVGRKVIAIFFIILQVVFLEGLDGGV